MFLDFKSFKPLRNFISSFSRKADPRVPSIEDWKAQGKTQEGQIYNTPAQQPSQYPTWESSNAEAESSRPIAPTPSQQVKAPVTQDPNVSPVQQNSSSKKEDPNYAYVYDPEHKMSSAELSELHPGKHFSRTEGGWTTLDPQQQREEELNKQEKTTGVSVEQPAKEKKPKEEKIDVSIATPEQIEQAQKKLYEFHRPPTEEEKQQIKDYTDNQINQYIDNVLSGNPNEASLPEMTDDEKVSFFIGLFAAERAKLVSQIKIQGRNRRRVQMAKELQAKIVGDLNQYANDNINYAIKTISERKEKPKTFGGSLNEFTNNNNVSEDGNTSEDYINDFVSRGGEGWDYGQRATMRGYDPSEITSAERESAYNVGQAALKGLVDSSDSLQNTILGEDFKVVDADTEGEVKSIIALGSNPPAPSSLNSLRVTFPLSVNTQQVQDAFEKIIKSLDKKNLGSLIEIKSPNDILMNTDNISIKARNWKELEEIHKIVDKEMSKINGVKTTIDDNRFGLTENEIVNSLADMKRKMKLSGDGSFTVDSEFDNQKLAKYALAAKSIGCTISDIGGKYVLKAIDGNSNAYNSGISPEDSDEEVLNKIKMADEKDKQEPAPLPDPNEDVRGLLGEQEKKNRELRMRNRKPQKSPVQKPAPAPKPVPAPKPEKQPKQPKPQVVSPTTQQPPELPLSSTTSEQPVMPTPVGTVSYVPQAKEPWDLEKELDEVKEWDSIESFQKLERMIKDFNVSVANASLSYDTLAMDKFKELGDKLDEVVRTKINLDALQPPVVDKDTVKKYYAIPEFKGLTELSGKGVKDIFQVNRVKTDGEKEKLKDQVKLYGKGDNKQDGKLDEIKDGIWISGKDEDFFSGWFSLTSTEIGKDGKESKRVKYISSDKSLSIDVPYEESSRVEDFIKRNPFRESGNWQPTISNMESIYGRKDFEGDKIPLSYIPSIDDSGLKSFIPKYIAIDPEGFSGQAILGGMLGIKNKIIRKMDNEERDIAIKQGMRKAIEKCIEGSGVKELKKALIYSKDTETGVENFGERQKQIIQEIDDEDFMKMLSGAQIPHQHEEMHKAKRIKSLPVPKRLDRKSLDLFAQTDKPHDLLELMLANPQGLFRMPKKEDAGGDEKKAKEIEKFSREISEWPKSLQRAVIRTDGKGSRLDQYVTGLGKTGDDKKLTDRSYGGGYGEGTPEDFLNDLRNQYSEFFSEGNKTKAQQEFEQNEFELGKQHQDAKRRLKPVSVLGRDVGEGDIFKVKGDLYKVRVDPKDPAKFILDGAKGQTPIPLESFFENKNGKISGDYIFEGYIPSKADSWQLMNRLNFEKPEEETTSEPTPSESISNTSIEDVLDEVDNNSSSDSEPTVKGLTQFPADKKPEESNSSETTPIEEPPFESEEEYQNWKDSQTSSSDDYNPLLDDEESWGSKKSSITNRRKRMAKKGRF